MHASKLETDYKTVRCIGFVSVLWNRKQKHSNDVCVL